jgi:transcriptional regulator with XRE-family HTH domain
MSAKKKEDVYILNIRNLMKEKNIKVFEIAAILKVTSNTVSNWLNGNNPMPVHQLIKICDVLKVDYASIFENVRPQDCSDENLDKILELERKLSELKDKIISLQDKLFEKIEEINKLSNKYHEFMLNKKQEKYGKK